MMLYIAFSINKFSKEGYTMSEIKTKPSDQDIDSFLLSVETEKKTGRQY